MSVMYREPSIIKKSKDGRVAAVDMASELLNSRVLLLERGQRPNLQRPH